MQFCFPIDLVPAAVERCVPRKGPGPLVIKKAKPASHPFPPNQVESQSQSYVPTKLAQFLAGEPRPCLFAVILVHRFLS